MSITDELRHNIEGAEQLYGCECKHLLAIADHIDAEHEEALVRSYFDGVFNDESFASVDEWLGQHENAMREHGWVKLPMDADGVPIHIGDELEDVDNPSSHGEVHRIELTPDACWVFVNGFGRTSNHYRHHHAPTVEDVLRGDAE